MKKLCLIRHAKASQNMFDLADIDRPLIDRGYKDAHAMSKKLSLSGFTADYVLTSPGIRALTTALIFTRDMHFASSRITIIDKLYNAALESVVDAISEIPAEARQVMLFGHNPSITNITNLLSSGFTEHVPTCGICMLEFQAKSWDALVPGSGKLVMFDYPKNM